MAYQQFSSQQNMLHSTYGPSVYEHSHTYAQDLPGERPPTYSQTVNTNQNPPYLPYAHQSRSEYGHSGYGLRNDSSSPEDGRKPPLSEEEGDDAILQRALAFTHHAPPSYTRQQRLQHPVAIPQVAVGLGMPFSRAYASALEAKGVTILEFTEFIDNLNIVSSSSPPLQVLDAAGAIFGLIPIHHAQAISGGIQLVSKLGNAVLSKTRGKMFIDKSNEGFFNPRGLTMQLVTGDALRLKLGLGPEAPLTHPIETSGDMNLQQRRLAALHGYTEPVTFDVPPPSEPSNALDKLCASQQQKNITRQEEKAMKDREKYMAEQTSGAGRSPSRDNQPVSEKDLSKIERKYHKEVLERDHEIAKINYKAESEQLKKPKDAEKIERKRVEEIRKVEKDFDKEVSKLDKHRNDSEKEQRKHRKEKQGKHGKMKEKEEKKAAKLLWILVENL